MNQFKVGKKTQAEAACMRLWTVRGFRTITPSLRPRRALKG